MNLLYCDRSGCAHIFANTNTTIYFLCLFYLDWVLDEKMADPNVAKPEDWDEQVCVV